MRLACDLKLTWDSLLCEFNSEVMSSTVQLYVDWDSLLCEFNTVQLYVDLGLTLV